MSLLITFTDLKCMLVEESPLLFALRIILFFMDILHLSVIGFVLNYKVILLENIQG